MIHLALQFLVSELNAFLLARHDQGPRELSSVLTCFQSYQNR